MKDSRKNFNTNFSKGFISGMITMVIIFTVVVNIIFPLLYDKFNLRPALRIVNCHLGFTDVYGNAKEKGDDGKWHLAADQDVVVWLDLPNTIEELKADVRSSYPYEVKAGEVGAIKVEVYCYANYTKYVGEMEFVATDDLTLGCVGHGINYANRSVGIKNDSLKDFTWSEDGKQTYFHYPLYTSCAGQYNVYPICGGQTSVGYDVHFDIIATGAPEMVHVSSWPDGNIEMEERARRFEEITRHEDQRWKIKSQIQELQNMLQELEDDQ